MEEVIRIRHCDTLLSKITAFRVDDRYSDIAIKVEEQVFKCHRLILSAASEYFDCMFSSGFKESSAMEITLGGIKANVFEGMLKFMYIGDSTAITSSNLRNFIEAAGFYKLPFLEELCFEFMQENLNDIANDVLWIFSFVLETSGKEDLVDFLKTHILKKFLYFSKTPEFSSLTFAGLQKILELGNEPLLQDFYLEGIFIWLRRQVDQPAKMRKLYFDELTSRINFKNLSIEYTEYLTKEYGKELLSIRSMDDDLETVNAVTTAPKFLHAFVASRVLKDLLPSNSSLYTLRRNIGIHIDVYLTWIYSGEFEHSNNCNPTFMRNVIVKDRLYSLSYFRKGREVDGPQLTFKSDSSILMYPYVSLKLPPLILEEFDMSATSTYIYVKSKRTLTGNTIIRTADAGGSTFSEDELSRGIYAYKWDADKWYPLPRPGGGFANACMTCDENVVYLIGGKNSNGSVQAYDSRTQDWTTLPSTTNVYDGAACCSTGSKIYVAGGKQDPKSVEMYDPVAGKWQPMRELLQPRSNKHQLLYVPEHPNYGDSPWILSFSNAWSSDANITVYRNTADTNNWFFKSSLFGAMEKYLGRKITANDDINILDMVYF